MKTHRQEITANHQTSKESTSLRSSCPPDIQKFICEALSKRKPSLIPFTLTSPTMTELMRYLKRHCSQSQSTAYLYTWSIQQYCHYCRSDPEQLIGECLSVDGLPNQKALLLEARRLDDYIGALQGENYSPGHISNCVKAVKTFFRVNGLKLDLPYKLHRYSITRDRAPTPDELSNLIDLADLRGKTIVAMLALAGFRLGTLCQLRYRHIREDLERGIAPLHIHVEATITKGKYHDYDAFVGKEAVDYLKAYLEARKKGGLPGRSHPENIQDESPLIRDEHSNMVKPVTPSQVYNVLHRLMAQAGLLGTKTGRRYAMRPHSIRKFFRTQMAALGVQTDYIEYMMGHTISTYNDIQMKGIEWLRQVYTASGLSIKPKSETNKMAIVRDFLKSMNLNPEEILSEEAQAMPHRTVMNYSQQLSEQEQIDTMIRALMQKLKQDIIAETLVISQKTV